MPGLNAAFAQPRTPGPHPAIIVLHPSGGGTTAGARSGAARFAQLGYAALAINYFAWPDAHIEGIPQALQNIPVETIERARAWLREKPGVSAERVSIWGWSKGAELALVAGSHYGWVDRIVACAASSYMWTGSGGNPTHEEPSPSWTLEGRPLPFIPYIGIEDSIAGKQSGVAMHKRSLKSAPEGLVEAARIPIERTNAKLLLLGGSRDQVWPSGEMVREMEDTLNCGLRSRICG